MAKKAESVHVTYALDGKPTEGDLRVWVNGRPLVPGKDFTVSGNVLKLKRVPKGPRR